jgi:hypothetical protein
MAALGILSVLCYRECFINKVRIIYEYYVIIG